MTHIVVKIGTEEEFFARGQQLARSADRGEPWPEQRILSFEWSSVRGSLRVDEQYKKSIFTRSYFDDTQFDLKEIEAAIPTGMQDVKTQLLWDNRFYCITFRTPGVC